MFGGSKSAKAQSTLFQTWGYQGNIIAPAKPSSTVALPKGKSHQLKKNTWKPNSNKPKQSLQLWASTSDPGQQKVCQHDNFMDRDFDDNDLMQGLDDDDAELSEAVNKVDKIYYVDSNFNPSASPENLAGFDNTAGDSYVYPINYPMRDYQFNIITKALIKNTLVVLPTGLGKTFIAAVVMYNFYRWYPQGKILFMAPTKPLVAQQIQACYNITGIPLQDTAEMTGLLAPQKRKLLWESKRVFFLTPQILQNDIGRGACFANNVVCLVFDEAHKALGNYAYCEVIKEVSGCQKNFRVLALSATPGDDMKAVQNVIENLMISHIELRSEDSVDIKPYVFDRNVQKIVVPLSEELKKTKGQFHQVLQGVIGRLYANGACWQSDPSKVSKFSLLKARDSFRERGVEDRNKVGIIEGDFALAISLYHAFELLQQHGILSFYNFLKEICSGNKGTTRARHELMRHEKFMEMMEDLRQRIEPPDNLDGSLNSSALIAPTPKTRLLKSIPKTNSLFSSHPKLNKLEEIIVKHFETAKEKLADKSSQTPLNTRVMIFSQYRDSVQEITSILNKHQPLVKVMSFVGQGGSSKGKKGLTQKEQLEVVERFRKGGYNVLVSTSVGEEGLDIGDVDLIVCFDVSSSPLRLVQRMGRTGRKRAGKIVILVTEGKEEQIYKRSLSNKKSIHKKLLNATDSLVLYDECPRMIPKHMNPYCLKMEITVDSEDAKNNRGKKRKSNDRKNEKAAQKKVPKKVNTIEKSIKSDGFLNDEEENYWRENFLISEDSCQFEGASTDTTRPIYPVARLNEWPQWQSIPQPTKFSTHSAKTYKFCEVIEHIETINAELDDDNYKNQELEKFMENNPFIMTESDQKERKKSSVLGKDTDDVLNDKVNAKKKGVNKNKDRKSDKQTKANSAKLWRQRNLLMKEEDSEDDDFMNVRKPAKLSKLSVESDRQMKSPCLHDGGSRKRDLDGEVESNDGDIGQNRDHEGEIQSIGIGQERDLHEEAKDNDDGDRQDRDIDWEVERNGGDDGQDWRQDFDMGVLEDCVDTDRASLVQVNHDNENIEDDMSQQGVCSNSPSISSAERDNDEMSSQKMSSLFPSTTPKRGAFKSQTPGSQFKFRHRHLNSLVPSPPRLTDLSSLSFGNISEFEKIDGENLVINDCVDNNTKREFLTPASKKTLEFGIHTDSLEIESSSSTVSRNPLLDKCSRNVKSSFKIDSSMKTDGVKRSVVGPKENFVCKKETDLKPEEISNFDLGESFADIGDLEDFEDCPSPPVVATIPTANDKKIKNEAGGYYDESCTTDQSSGDRKSSTPARLCGYQESRNKKLDMSDAEIRNLGQTGDYFDRQTNCIKSSPTSPMCTKDECPETTTGGISNAGINQCETSERSKVNTSEQLDLDVNDPGGFYDEWYFPPDSGVVYGARHEEIDSGSQWPAPSLASRLRTRNIPGLNALKNGGKEMDLLREFPNPDFCVETETNHKTTKSLNTKVYNGIRKQDGISRSSDAGSFSPKHVVANYDMNRASQESSSCEEEEPHFVNPNSASKNSRKKLSLSRKKLKSPDPSLQTNIDDDSPLVHKKNQKQKDGNFKSPEPSLQTNVEDDSPLVRKKNRKQPKFADENSDDDGNEDDDSPLKFRKRKKARVRDLDESTDAESCREILTGYDRKRKDSSNVISRNTATLRHKLKQRVQIDDQESDDDFDMDKSMNQFKNKAKKKNLSKESKQNKRPKNRRAMSEFIDDEAEETDAVSGDEEVGLDQDAYVMDSFIDDGTQMSQPTPARNHKEQKKFDMSAIYRQSLFSPICGALNFRTPALRAGGNRYKMVGREAWYHPSDDDDEAEEVNGLISEEDFEEDFEEEEDSLEDVYTDNDSPYPSQDQEESSDEAIECKVEEFRVPPAICRSKKSRVRRIVESDDESSDSHINTNNKDSHITTDEENAAPKMHNEIEISPEIGSMTIRSKLKLGKKNSRKRAQFIDDSPISCINGPLGNNCGNEVTAIDDSPHHSDSGTLFAKERRKNALSLKRSALDERAMNVAAPKSNSSAGRSENLIESLTVYCYKSLQSDRRNANCDEDLQSDGHSANSTTEEAIISKRNVLKSEDAIDSTKMLKSSEQMSFDNHNANSITKVAPESSISNRSSVNSNSETASESNMPAMRGVNSFDNAASTSIKCSKISQLNRYSNDVSTLESDHLKMNVKNSDGEMKTESHLSELSSDEQSSKVIETMDTVKPILNEEELVGDGRTSTYINQWNFNLDESFVPDFDLGLDLGELNIEMIESSWKEISPSVLKMPPMVGQVGRQILATSPISARTCTQRDIIIFAQSKINSSCQIGSFLRLKHNISLKVCSQLACDFNVSKRLGVIRRTVSDISSGATGSKNMEAIREMCEQYSERCVIIEKDRVKGTSVNEKVVSYTKYYSGLLGYLAELKIKLLFSDSQEETALLISKLAKRENEKNHGFCEALSKIVEPSMEQMLKVMLTVPHLTYPIAIELCHKFKTFAALMKSTPEEMKAKIPQVSTRKAKELIQFFHHEVNLI